MWLVERLRSAVAGRLGTITHYGFEEYLHGLTGVPGGTPQMAYTATGLLFLQLAASPARLSVLEP